MDIGKAYAFFDCKAPRDVVEHEMKSVLESLINSGEIRAGLELNLYEGTSNIRGDRELLELARRLSRKYFIEAQLKNESNREAGLDLVAVTNNMCMSNLYTNGDKFKGEIVFEEHRDYQIIRWLV